MTANPTSLLERYQPYRRVVEPGFWIFNYCLSAILDSAIVLLDFQRAQLPVVPWHPIVWEWSSHLVLLALVPVVIAFERRVPLHFETLKRNLPLHALGTVVYNLIHVVAMVGLRKLTYASQGEQYDFGNWPHELFYE